jgi:3-hydroxyisobutyrate dehydrogenase-like beta-hydroxyacid dehydrogenase
MARIGFIGLGIMGLPMAQNLIRAGHTVVGMDVNTKQMEKLAKAGGTVTPNIREAVAGADVVVTMLPDNQLAREIYLRAG